MFRSALFVCVFALLPSLLGCSDSADGSAGAAGNAGASGSSGSGGSAGSSAAGGSAGAASGGSGGSAGAGSGGSAGAGTGGAAGNSNFVPYFADDFESYPDGQSLSSNKPFDAAGRSSATTEQAHRGAQAAKMEIRNGDAGGFGKWGGVLPIKPTLKKGQEVWVRLWVMWPSSFQFSATPFMKFLRLHNRTASGMNGGYNDLYVDNADGTTSVLRTIKEVHDKWAIYDGPKLPRDQWERYEMYLYIDDQAVDSGGGGRVRIWRDAELIFDRTDVPTITDASGTIDSFYLFTYWNNEMPPDNFVYVDDLAVATSASPPPNRDANGNPYLGDW